MINVINSTDKKSSDTTHQDASSTTSKPAPVVISALSDISFLKLFDPNSPWVLVHEGSLMGFFDFVPRSLRVGPWHTAAPIYMTIFVAKLIYWMPQKESFYLDDEILSAHPLAYSATWFYNVVTFFWMKFVLFQTLSLRGPGVIVTYTIQSWMMLTTRHGLSALAPFLPKQHFLLRFNEILRFPALASATITFFYWNFLLAPIIYYNIKGEERRKAFFRFNFNFRMIQVHFFNIVFAVLNTIVTSCRKFQFLDLWCALAGALGYALLYLLVLDRFGVHLYPIFSPRTVWSLLSWSAILGTYFLVFHVWNEAITLWSPLFREIQGLN